MLYLTRHTETDGNRAGIIQGADDSFVLNETGKAQAAMVAEKLKRFNIEKIVSSDLTRTKQTAEIIKNILNITVEYDPRIREYNFGRLNGWSKGAIDPAMLGLFISNPTATEFNAEPFDDAFTRVGDFLGTQDYSRNILVVTHSNVLYFMMCYLENKNKFDVFSYLDKSMYININNSDILRLRNLKSEMNILRGTRFYKMKKSK